MITYILLAPKEEKKEVVVEPEQEVTEIEFEDEKYDLEVIEIKLKYKVS